MPRLRPARALVPLTLAATTVMTAPAALAHDSLVSTNPVAGSTLEAAPQTLQLRFAEPALNLGNQIMITAPDGTTAARTPTVADTVVSAPLTATKPGLYRVQWRVTSADGHPVSGTFQFTVGGSGNSSAATTSSTSATTTDGAAAPSTSSSPTTVTGPSTPTTNEPGDNKPKLVIGGFAALAALVAAGWFVARRRMRDDAR